MLEMGRNNHNIRLPNCALCARNGPCFGRWIVNRLSGTQIAARGMEGPIQRDWHGTVTRGVRLLLAA
jgi:hypothetical protein